MSSNEYHHPYLSEPGPALDRQVTVRFLGDWGQMNLTRVCNWIGQEVMDRSPAGSRTAVWNGRGGADAFEALRAHDVDIAMATPAAFANMCIEGRGGFEPFPEMCSLGIVGQDDRLVIAVGAELGFETLDDIKAAQPALTIVTSPDDGVNLIGFAAHRLLEAVGLPRELLESWGGSFIEYERPHDCLPVYGDGTADAVIHEAIMAPFWDEPLEAHPARFMQIPRSALDELQATYMWPSGTLPPGYHPGIDSELLTLDFSDFVLLTTTSLPDDVARLVAWSLANTGYQIDRQYAHVRQDRSPLSYPVTPQKVASSPVPLHPAAAAFYREHDLID